MKRAAATTFDDDTIELGSTNEADKSLSLMAGPQKNSQSTQVKPNEKEELFLMKIQVKHEVIEAIVDTDSQKNLISASLVRKLGLPTTQHPSPYSLGWISNNMDTQVKEQCHSWQPISLGTKRGVFTKGTKISIRERQTKVSY
ncbi:hypothetical protein Tco_1512874 [Tanacetum coccineum]